MSEKPAKPRVLILCTGNSCRSHMAEGILRAAADDLLEVHSAGSKPAGYVHPKAMAALEEIGIDISRHTSKHMDDFLDRDIETVITVCGNADQACPMFPGQMNRYHWGFDDPAHATGSEDVVMNEFRRVRDEIRRVFEAYAAGRRDESRVATTGIAMFRSADSEEVRQKVREGYGKIAAQGGSCCGPSPTCCGSSPAASDDLAERIGYSREELAAIPEGANMGLSCGNPGALAALQPGEVVLDLGAGGGFDVFVAGSKIGPTGRAIGVDSTAEMLVKARKNIAAYTRNTGLDNVEFRLGEIEHLPVADASVDVVISNCVINLSPDKPQVWREIARVLRPGGRVAVSDLGLLKKFPPAVVETVEALIGCVAGAVLVAETEQMAKNAGLADIVIGTNSSYIDSMVDWQDPVCRNIISHLPSGAKPSDYITSLDISARKPSRNCCC